MRHGGSKRFAAAAAVAALAAAAGLAPPVRAEQLAVRRYGVADGLAHSRVECIRQDAKGYLWFGTWEGLSRFDGVAFKNYGVADGLPHPIVTALAEDRRGRLWVGTHDGLARLVDEPAESRAGSKFESFRVGNPGDGNVVLQIVFGPDDALWCLTNAGLYRASAADPPAFELVGPNARDGVVGGAGFADGRGRLWFGLADEIFEVDGGRTVLYGKADGLPAEAVVAVAEDARGRLFAATLRGLFEFDEPENPDGRGRWQHTPFAAPAAVNAAALDPAGPVYLGTHDGLICCEGGRQTLITTANGLADVYVTALASDREGDIWIGTAAGGVCELLSRAFVNFTTTDGLPVPIVSKLVESHDGRIYATMWESGVVEIVGGRAVPVLGSAAPPFNTAHRRILQDRRGDWWIGTDSGVYRFTGPGLQFRRGGKVAGVDASDEVFSLYEDRGGNVWVGMLRGGMYRVAPDGSVERTPAERLAPLKTPVAMTSGPAGELWLATYGGVGRLVGGAVSALAPSEGLPEVQGRSFCWDSRGRLWIGLRYRGVSVTADPGSAEPSFVNYSTRDGLASDTVWAVCEDDRGRVYLGTGKGLDRLDPETGAVRHLPTAGGLAGDVVSDCLRDRAGNVWVATATGLTRIEPHEERADPAPPQTYVTRVRIADEDLPIPERGATSVASRTLSADENDVLVEFAAPRFAAGRPLRYQYRLGADADWSAPSEVRSVNFARLAPGPYRLLVRAVDPEGGAPSAPAEVSFTILPPIWQRWWFVAAAVALAAAAALALHRARVRRVLAMERVRRQIATDLHDDVGSGLSQVAILAEVAQREATPEAARMLAEAADLARGMRESMSDIVWAVDPRRDRLADLVLRMQQAAFNLLESAGVRVVWNIPGQEAVERIGLAPDVRRHVLLVFKEAMTNVARHAGATTVRVDLVVGSGALRLSVADDGRGFDAARDGDGTGLRSMRRRAEELGASLAVESRPGGGTEVRLVLPHIRAVAPRDRPA